MNQNKQVFMVNEHKQTVWFPSIADAEKKTKIRHIHEVLNKNNKTAGGFWWVTEKDTLSTKDFKKGKSTPVYACKNDKKFIKFESVKFAAHALNVNSGNIVRAMNNPNFTTGKYWFCDDPDIFSNVDLISGKGLNKRKTIYSCDKNHNYIAYSSVKEAASKMDVSQSTISDVINKPTYTAGGIWWCDKLEVFDDIELSRNISTPQQIIINEIKKIGYDVVINDRKILQNNQEIDIFIPELNTGIEFNGDYWHSEKKIGKYYHQNKSLRAIEIGVKLFHIYSYDLFDESFLTKFIAKITPKKNKIFAKQCVVKEIDFYPADFIDDTHLIGSGAVGFKVGLFHNEELVAVSIFANNPLNKNFQWEIVRVAFKKDTTITGGFEKMLKYFIRNKNPNNLITFASLDHSVGEMYIKAGLVKTRISPPSYRWCNGATSFRRWSTQKKKLQSLFSDCDITKTEKEIMEENGFFRVFNAGAIVFEWSQIK